MSRAPCFHGSQGGRFAFSCITVLLLSCAGGPDPVSEEDLHAHLLQQQAWLEGLRQGMSVNQALDGANSHRYYQFEILRDNTAYLYVQGRGAVTQTLYGLYFEDGELVSLLLNQDVTAADACHFHVYQRQDAWPVDGFDGTDAWIRINSQLGGSFAKVSGVLPGVQSDQGSGAARAVEAVTHGALAVVVAPVALPFMAMSSQDDFESEVRAGPIELGASRGDELVARLGRPTYVRKTSWGERWDYTADDAAYGLVDDILVWRESGWWGTPTNAHSGRVSCPSLGRDP